MGRRSLIETKCKANLAKRARKKKRKSAKTKRKHIDIDQDLIDPPPVPMLMSPNSKAVHIINENRKKCNESSRKKRKIKAAHGLDLSKLKKIDFKKRMNQD